MIVPLRVLMVAVVLAPVLQAAPPGFVMWSSSELEQRDAAAYRFRFIYRDADGFPEIHEDGLDVVFVKSGKGTLLVGGEMLNRTGVRGTGISGGFRYPLGPGDIIHIPANTPHRYLVPEGGHITYVLVRVPAFVGEAVVLTDAPVLQFDPPGFAMWKASELKRRDAALSTRVGRDHSARETLADYGNPAGAHRFRFIHRDADGIPEIHDDIIDVVFVQSGAGTLLVGGEMLNRTGGRGTGISGGTRYPLGPGDMIHIPRETPHSYLVPEGGHITYVLVRVPAFNR